MRFTEVDFSELILLRQPTTKSSKNQFGRSEVQPSVVGKSLLYSPLGLIFSATMPKAKNQSRHINSLVVGEPSLFFASFLQKRRLGKALPFMIS